MWTRMMTRTTHRGLEIWSSCPAYIRSCFSDTSLPVRFIAGTASTVRAYAVNKISLAQRVDGSFSRTDLRSLHSAVIPAHKDLRTQKFEQTLELISTNIGRTNSKSRSLQVRNSAWLYLFDLAACPQQLERASSKFLQFVECGRQFHDEHVNSFVRRCVELRCPELALTIFSNRLDYRMDLTITAARQLLYALHERRQLSNVAILAALFPLYNLPALSSDPTSCALLVSACLREANSSGSEPAWIVATTLLLPLKQLLSQTPPMRLLVEGTFFIENGWMKDAMLSILESLDVQGQEVGWVRDWCDKSSYNK
ncbi:hypothetical protein F5148DRAFT_993907 [Russula earlei]|uniref:Uncharacterized protein n=1 Tax=Russula earlei TaxID=71964 RepID=A0ACC0UIU4_9AGAM|nr:hypothetical protein F5148DRAFT_993907 [Russula earlei]